MKIICCTCKEEKDCIFFNKNKSRKNGFSNICKMCHKKYMMVYKSENLEKLRDLNKKYKLENSEKLKEQSILYRVENKDKIKEYQKEYRSENYDSLKLKNDIWREKSCFEKSEKRKKYKREWLKNNRKLKPWYYAHRDLLNSVVKRIGIKKVTNTITELGYSDLDLKLHIESLFIDDMSWDNYGKWHIDHKTPVSKFTKDDSFSVVNSLDNLQPLWAEDNLKKYNN